MDESSVDKLVAQLREAARADPATNWHDLTSDDAVAFVEDSLDVKFSEILRRCYTQISNGGFGPGYQLTGLPGGHESSWGDLIQTRIELRRHEDCEEEWLPLIDWGCAQFTILDCSDEQIVTLYEGDFYCEGYTFKKLLSKWVLGEVPRLDTGSFHPRQ